MEREHGFKFTPRKVAALGLIALVSAGTGVLAGMSSRTGDVHEWGPLIERDELLDNTVNIVNWNMHGELSSRIPELQEMVKENDVDAVLLQEVSENDAEKLRLYFLEWKVHHVTAEGILQEPWDGGFGNVIMTKGSYKSYESKIMNGESMLTKAWNIAEGFIDDTENAYASFDNTNKGMQERRAISSVTLTVGSERRPLDIELATAHISYKDGIRYKQLGAVLDFITKRKKKNRPLVIGADLNLPREIVSPTFLDIGMTTEDPGIPTIVGSSQTTDYFIYRSEGMIESISTEVLPNATDHHALLTKIALKKPQFELNTYSDRTRPDADLDDILL